MEILFLTKSYILFVVRCFEIEKTNYRSACFVVGSPAAVALLRADGRLDPYDAVRVGEAQNPGPPESGGEPALDVGAPNHTKHSGPWLHRAVEDGFIMGAGSAENVNDIVVDVEKSEACGLAVANEPGANWRTSLGARRSRSIGVALALDAGAPNHTKHSGLPDLGSSISSASTTGAACTPAGKALSWGLGAKATPGAEEGAEGVAHRSEECGRQVGGCFIMGVESAENFTDVESEVGGTARCETPPRHRAARVRAVCTDVPCRSGERGRPVGRWA